MESLDYDPELWSELALKLLEGDINYWCMKYNIGGYEHEDLQQECRLKLWVKMNNYNHQQGTGFRTWANYVIKNQLKDLLKYSQYDKRRISSEAVIMSSAFWGNV